MIRTGPLVLSQAAFPMSRLVPGAIWNIARYSGLVLAPDSISSIAAFTLTPDMFDDTLRPRYRSFKCVARAVLSGPLGAVVTYRRFADIAVGSAYWLTRQANRISKFSGSTNLLVEFCFDLDFGLTQPGDNASIAVQWEPTPFGPITIASAEFEIVGFKTSGNTTGVVVG